jgi:hypothetical protein
METAENKTLKFFIISGVLLHSMKKKKKKKKKKKYAGKNFS